MVLLDKRGFSLVEMMVALAILGFVLALGFTFYAFGANSFNTGQSQSNVQQNTRLAADIISKEVRFASSLEIIAVNESYTFSPQKRYIYVKDGSFKIRKDGVEESLLENISDNIIFSLKFFRDNKGDKILYFEVSANNSGRISTVDSEVQILNIGNIGIKPQVPEDTAFSGNAICYTIGAAVDAASVAAAITSVPAPAPGETELTLPDVPSGYTIKIKTSDTPGVIATDGVITPPETTTIVSLVFTVTKVSDNTTAVTASIAVTVPPTATAASVAESIKFITAPAKDATYLNLPPVPTGYSIQITSASPTGVIDTNGTITPPDKDTAITLIFTVTKISDGSTAVTEEINVLVPEKTNIPPIDPLVLDLTALPDAEKNKTYSFLFKASGGDGVLKFTGSDIPKGFNIQQNGIFSGKENSGTYTFTITVSDNSGHSNSHEFSLVVK